MKKRTKTGGRAKGTPNKATAIHREFIQELLNKQGNKLETELSRLQGKEFISAMLQFMEFVMPKLQRQQVLLTHGIENKIPVPIIEEIYDEETEQSSFNVYLSNNH